MDNLFIDSDSDSEKYQYITTWANILDYYRLSRFDPWLKWVLSDHVYTIRLLVKYSMEWVLT